MPSAQGDSATLSTGANSQLFEQTANGRSQGETVENCDCTPRTAKCDRVRSKCDRIRSEFDRPDRTKKVPLVDELDNLFDQCDRSPSLTYELDTDNSLSTNLSVQPPVSDRTDRKTDKTLIGEDTEAFDRPDRMRSNAIEKSDRRNTSPQGAASTSWNPEPTSPTQFRVGDRVFWENCPSCCEELAPFEITAIDGDYAKLDLINKPVPLAELTLAT
jgi:hypothetical protein